MKKHFRYAIIIMALLPLTLWMTGCSDDNNWSDVDGAVPTLSLTTSHIQTAAGRTFTIEGTVTDADGISTIDLVCADLYLGKTIDIIDIYGEPLTSYDLSYSFSLQSDEIGESFTIQVTVTDIGGRSVTQELLVTLDGDFASPVFTSAPGSTVTVLMKEETAYTLNFTVTDDRELDYVIVDIDGLNDYTDLTIDISGTTSYTYSSRLIFPSEIADYPMTLTVADAVGNITTVSSIISISELQDFDKMWLADVATSAELNSDVFGVPMLVDHVGEYEYQANYYCSKANTEIFFLPQKNDFSPICFGLDPDDNTTLTSDPDLAEPIVLEEANVYYQITFNTLSGDYSISTYSIEDAIDPIPHEIGSISLDTWGDGGSWLQEFYIGYMTSSPSDVTRMAQDTTNPHLFYLETPLELEAGTQMSFLIHNWHSDGWWNYCTWRVDDSYDPEVFGYYGNYKNEAWTGTNTILDNWAKPTVNTTGRYRLWFDAHLGRGKLVPVD